MIITACVNEECRKIIHLNLQKAEPWVDEDGGTRCPQPDMASPIRQHTPDDVNLVLQIVCDAMEDARVETAGPTTPHELMRAVRDAMIERVGLPEIG